jgi:transposase-like protein
MGQVLHKCAKTTFKVRKEIQDSKESIKALSKKYNINPKTVIKWKKRTSVEDLPLGPRKTRTVLTPLEETVIVELRKKSLLSLDDLFIALKEEIPHLTRSNLHRCLQRNGVSKLPKEENKKEKKKFKQYPIGFIHIDVCEIQLPKEKVYLFVGIDRTSKFAYARAYERATVNNSVDFLEKLQQIIPYKINKILTDNGIQFTDKAQRKYATKEHAFDACCKKYGIEHRLTKYYHPWTNGQVERMNRSIKDATIRIYYYKTKEEVMSHINDYLQAYNFGKKLKSLQYKTPYEYIMDQWEKDPKIFRIKPDPYLLGLNTNKSL